MDEMKRSMAACAPVSGSGSGFGSGLLLAVLLSACGSSSTSAPASSGAPTSPPSTSASSTSSASAGGADGGTFESYTLAAINRYRVMANNGAAPLVLDGQLDAFAAAGSTELSQDHRPHAHFTAASNDGSIFDDGFGDSAAENQGDPDGDPLDSGEDATIDSILAAMYAEGPGGGHHDNMVDPTATRLGVGLVVAGGNLYFTNDFSP